MIELGRRCNNVSECITDTVDTHVYNNSRLKIEQLLKFQIVGRNSLARRKTIVVGACSFP